MQFLNAASHLLSEVQLKTKLEREVIPSRLDELDGMIKGLPRGAITEVFGPPSSGRTTFLHSFLASSTNLGEYCAIVDSSDAFDPASADGAGVDLKRLLWVRCALKCKESNRVEQAIKATDLLIHSGGWGVIVMDLGDISAQLVRRLPISYWYRFRRAIESTPTILVVMEREPYVKACASVALEMDAFQPMWSGGHVNFRVLHGSRMKITPKKPVCAQTAVFQANALAG